MSSIVALFFILQPFNGYSQTCIDVNIPTYNVPLNSDFILDIHVNNFPTKGSVIVVLNGNKTTYAEGDIHLAIKDTAIGIYQCNLEIEVFNAGKRVSKWSKSIVYQRFSPFVSIESVRGNFYRQIENIFTLSVSGIASPDITFTALSGMIRKLEGNTYAWSPGVTDTVFKLLISAKLSNGTIMVLERRNIPLQQIPKPKLTLFRPLKDLVIADTDIQLELSCIDFREVEYTPLSYTALVYKKGVATEYKGSGSALKSDLVEALKNLSTGDWVCFMNIEYTTGLRLNGVSVTHTLDAQLLIK